MHERFDQLSINNQPTNQTGDIEVAVGTLKATSGTEAPKSRPTVDGGNPAPPMVDPNIYVFSLILANIYVCFDQLVFNSPPTKIHEWLVAPSPSVAGFAPSSWSWTWFYREVQRGRAPPGKGGGLGGSSAPRLTKHGWLADKNIWNS